MSGAAREKDQADFDLNRFVNMFDEAVTSRDPRVIDALRSLMMIVALTKPESRDSELHDQNAGPLRRLYEDVNHLNRRLHRMEDEMQHLNKAVRQSQPYSYSWNEEIYRMAEAKEMAQHIDQEVLNQLKMNSTMKINSSAIKGLK
jgi:predicted RNase H-like nuclease (RuvC/YqgF family)